MANRIKGFCSHCFEYSYHIEQQWNVIRRNIYVCEACKKSTVQCRLCKNFAKGGSFYDDELCAEHDRTISSFQKTDKIKIYSVDDITKLDSNIGYELKKVKDGVGDTILFIDGFLNEKNSNREKWEKELKILYPNNPWYILIWKSKQFIDFISVEHIVKHGILKKIPLPIPPVLHLPIAIQHCASVWKEAKNSAEQTGIHLGNILKNIKNEKIILCGHSLGSKVIYHTLIQISQEENSINKSIIKEVHLLGGAEDSSSDNWEYTKKSISGNIYNYYSKNDDILKYIYQVVELNTSKPIGRNPIKGNKIVNKDVTKYVSGHTKYISSFSKIYKL